MPNEDSNQPAHPRCLIRVFVGHINFAALAIQQSPSEDLDSANAQADLNLCWAHMSEGKLSDVAAHFCFHFIPNTCLYNFDSLKPHFYIVKLGFTGVYIIFLISAQKQRLWVLVRTASPRRGGSNAYPQSMFRAEI